MISSREMRWSQLRKMFKTLKLSIITSKISDLRKILSYFKGNYTASSQESRITLFRGMSRYRLMPSGTLKTPTLRMEVGKLSCQCRMRPL